MTDNNQRVNEQADSGASFADVVIDLREYASNPGYSHADYADTMRQAANCIESLRALIYNFGAIVKQAAPEAPAAASVIGDYDCYNCGGKEHAHHAGCPALAQQSTKEKPHG